MRRNKNLWICSQLGAREHYMVPRALYDAGLLTGMVTDLWMGAGLARLGRYAPTTPLKAAFSRYHSDLKYASVRSSPFQALKGSVGSIFHPRRDCSDRYNEYCQVGSRYASGVASVLGDQKWLSEGRMFFGYDTCSLETFAVTKSYGLKNVLGQTDPCRTEIEMVQQEEKEWPHFVTEPLIVPDVFYDRHHAEWEAADNIIVNSSFSEAALIQQGVDPLKISVVPLAYENQDHRNCQDFASTIEFPQSLDFKRPLNVLFLGQVMLRKGIQYLLTAADSMRSLPVQFNIVGPVLISEAGIRSAPSNVRFHGRVSRQETQEWYRSADLYILPTLSDGFALTQLEAMAHGLPVIATPNCGEVVQQGVNGQIVPARSAEAIVSALTNYLDKPELLFTHSQSAFSRSRDFSKQALADHLQTIATNMIG